MRSETPRVDLLPMTDDQRAELIEELIDWASDHDSMDWDYVDAQD